MGKPSPYVINVHINKVALRRPGLVLGWVTGIPSWYLTKSPTECSLDGGLPRLHSAFNHQGESGGERSTCEMNQRTIQTHDTTYKAVFRVRNY